MTTNGVALCAPRFDGIMELHPRKSASAMPKSKIKTLARVRTYQELHSTERSEDGWGKERGERVVLYKSWHSRAVIIIKF